jgi:hypothetical protein
MHLVQVLLPLEDNAGRPLGRELFEATRKELVERFGGITAYSGVPAEGVWKESGGSVVLDRIVVLEVQTERIERDYWKGYRERLEERFRQESVVIRAIPCDVL